MSERVTPPAGAWGASNQSLTPRAGHGVVIVVSIALAAALVASSQAAGGAGLIPLIPLLMLLLSCAALIVPVAVMAMTWAHSGPRVRGLFAAAGLACLVVLGFAVAGIVVVAPAVLS
jgi:hypothetical protein